MLGDPHVTAVPVPKMYGSPAARCDERCLATQHGRMTGNDLVAVLLHLASDPNCRHCKGASRPSADEVYAYIAALVGIARASGPKV